MIKENDPGIVEKDIRDFVCIQKGLRKEIIMIDEGTAVGAGLVVFASKDVIIKVLGPTADYLGNELKYWTELRLKNLTSIFNIAAKKLGPRLEKDGVVPARVLKGIIDEGSFCDDELTAEYFGGVLASSRSGISRDDRGGTFLSLISKLSSYQIRSHYIFYHIFKNLYTGSNINPAFDTERAKMLTFIPYSTFVPAMDFSEKEDFNVIIEHIMHGLFKENLLEGKWAFGPTSFLQNQSKSTVTDGIICQPSGLGIELFLWVYGRSDLVIQMFLNAEVNFDLNESIEIKEGYVKTSG